MTAAATQPTQAVATTRGPLLAIRDLAVSFDNPGGERVQAVDGLSLTVHPGQTVAVVGESGCGKSVSAMSVLRLLPSPPARINRGRVLWSGDDADGRRADLLQLPARDLRQVRGAEIAMIFQEPVTSLNPVYTVGDQIVEAVMLHQRIGRRAATDATIGALHEVGIAEPQRRIDQYPHQFSGGMRQRVMIAMALACRPRLLIADEPTTALDVTIQAQILELLARLRRERRMAIVLITHDLGVVAQNADVVCVMYAGRVVEYATVPELFERPLHPYTRGLLTCVPQLGSRRARLVTVREIVDSPGQFTRLPGAERGLRPWWPRHDPPADLARSAGPAGDFALHEVVPGHWVGMWRTQAIAAETPRPPDLEFTNRG